MFRPQDIQARLREQPFHPFQLVLTTGQVYTIPHPEFAMVTQRDVFVGVPTDVPIPDHGTRVAILHIVELRDLPAPAASGNGPA